MSRYRCIANSQLRIDRPTQQSFNKWLAATRPSKSSRMTDLPSSQLPCKESLIITSEPQLFVVIDTCSIIGKRPALMDYVTRLSELFRGRECPVKFIISLPVLEELDKCNRRKKKYEVKSEEQPSSSSSNFTVNIIGGQGDSNNNLNDLKDPNDPVLSELLAMAQQREDNSPNQNQQQQQQQQQLQDPPRMLARFIEEEMRMGQRMTGELDPLKQIALRELNFEIVNKDDRILECCLRTQAFIRSLPHHPQTKTLLVTEDNLFKSKATTFEIPSYRWDEFCVKYKNFGLKNFISTPIIPNGRRNIFSSYSSSFSSSLSSSISSSQQSAIGPIRLRGMRITRGPMISEEVEILEEIPPPGKQEIPLITID